MHDSSFYAYFRLILLWWWLLFLLSWLLFVVLCVCESVLCPTVFWNESYCFASSYRVLMCTHQERLSKRSNEYCAVWGAQWIQNEQQRDDDGDNKSNISSGFGGRWLVTQSTGDFSVVNESKKKFILFFVVCHTLYPPTYVSSLNNEHVNFTHEVWGVLSLFTFLWLLLLLLLFIFFFGLEWAHFLWCI